MSVNNQEKKMPAIPESAFVAEGAVVKGQVTLGENSSIWYNATVRADRATITIGRIPDNSLVLGNPGKVKREVTPEEIEANRRNAMHYVEEARN